MDIRIHSDINRKKGNIYKWNQNKTIYGFTILSELLFFFFNVRECLAFMEQ